MTCQNCAARIEKALKELPGVSKAIVDLKMNQASLNYNPAIVDLIEIRNTVIKAGYSIPTQEVSLEVAGMSCVSCLAHVEGALQNLPGVIEAAVSLSEVKAQVQYIPGVVMISQMEAAVQAAGYSAHPLDHQQKAREEGVLQPDGNQKTAEIAGLFAWVKKTLKKPGTS